MTVKSGATWSGLIACKDGTGALSTPSVGPVGALYVDGVINGATVTITGSNPYKWTVTLPTLTAGQRVSMYITATIATIARADVVAEESADTRLTSELHSTVLPNELLGNLVAYWPGDEVSGDRSDVHINRLKLLDLLTVTSNPGLTYPFSRQYTRVNGECHSRDDEPLLSPVDEDWTIAAWLYLDSIPAASILYAVSKFHTTSDQRAFVLGYNTTSARFYLSVYPTGTATVTQILAANYGAANVGTWYLVIAWHDSVLNTINIQVNNGTPNSAAHTTGVFDSTAPWRVGGMGGANWDGRIGPVAFWRAILIAAQRTALYNHGVGLAYPGTLASASALAAVDTTVTAVLDDTGSAGVALADNAITKNKFDETTAFPQSRSDVTPMVLP
jgi:hypothetical protein